MLQSMGLQRAGQTERLNWSKIVRKVYRFPTYSLPDTCIASSLST